ncbi:NUDIX hydrolase [Streptomyces sp. NBRC 109706]|uniref:NUDIX hydrolase n=1 Tax=Streptomyces sp. NBRC 109706 TaxID=1550035 RepID=UPI000784F871|nr:NUDIX domain-containing protein [Streptomyces sp. NBRC 109706]
MSLHEDAARVLRGWPAPDERQEELRAAYVAHLSAHPDGVWKRCAAGHITASALVVDRTAGRVLLTLHAKLGRWLQTGGHCEPSDVSLADAALREASEESGIDGLRLLAAPVRLDRHETPCATHLDVQYAALAPADAAPVISEESLALRWFDFDEAERLPDASVRALVVGARAVL